MSALSVSVSLIHILRLAYDLMFQVLVMCIEPACDNTQSKPSLTTFQVINFLSAYFTKLYEIN
jgi:hypothetical protein